MQGRIACCIVSELSMSWWLIHFTLHASCYSYTVSLQQVEDSLSNSENGHRAFNRIKLQAMQHWTLALWIMVVNHTLCSSAEIFHRLEFDVSCLALAIESCAVRFTARNLQRWNTEVNFSFDSWAYSGPFQMDVNLEHGIASRLLGILCTVWSHVSLWLERYSAVRFTEFSIANFRWELELWQLGQQWNFLSGCHFGTCYC